MVLPLSVSEIRCMFAYLGFRLNALTDQQLLNVQTEVFEANNYSISLEQYIYSMENILFAESIQQIRS